MDSQSYTCSDCQVGQQRDDSCTRGGDFHKVRDGLQVCLEDEVNAESSEEGGNYFNATVLVAWFKPFSPYALMLDKQL